MSELHLNMSSSLSGGGGGSGNNLSHRPNLTQELMQLEGFVRAMIEDWRYQARVGPVPYYLLVLLYACMILFGATGNLLVILVVVRNAAMRTARNVFIVNLAVSDLMLCLITMPLTLVEILYMTWQFGNYPAACPVAALLQGTSIFVSTLSITAIALDRRQLIVCPHKGAIGIKAMLACVPLIWALSITLASPMAIWKKLEYWTEWTNLMNILDSSSSPNSTDPTSTDTEVNCTAFLAAEEDNNNNYEVVLAEDQRLDCMFQQIMPRWLHELQSCKEDFPENGRLAYSAVTMVIQYLLPTVTISIAYYQIFGQLRVRLQQKRNQLSNTNTNNGDNNTSNAVVDRIENDIVRMKRTTNLLIWVGVMFCVCWLPLNILNTVMDITEKDRIDAQGNNVKSVLTDQQFCILYAVCHVTGMLSACANPVIYGYLNENFNREFKDILEHFRRGCRRLRGTFKKGGKEEEQQQQQQQQRGTNGVEMKRICRKEVTVVAAAVANEEVKHLMDNNLTRV